MTKPDKILIGAVIALSMVGYLMFYLVYRADAPLTAEISVNGTIVNTIDLYNPTPNQFINISGPLGTSVAEVKPGAIRMQFSPCPDRICMETGWIDQPGQVIACVPNKIIIKINPDKNSVDAISR